MIPQFLKNVTKKTLVLFDMDGVLAEFIAGENARIRRGEDDTYINKRPVKTFVDIANYLSMQDNITVGVLSSCCTENQRAEKLTWLKRHAPFFPNDYTFILVWEKLNYTKENKSYAKAHKIQTIQGFDKIHLIDDRHDVISATNELLPDTAHHLIEFLE